MARGLETLWFKRHLMRIERFGAFAWMLISHKLVRWFAFLTLPGGLLGLVILTQTSVAARWVVFLLTVGIGMGALGWYWPQERRVPRSFALPAFVLMATAASIAAWNKALSGERNPIWEPTRRPGGVVSSVPESGPPSNGGRQS